MDKDKRIRKLEKENKKLKEEVRSYKSRLESEIDTRRTREALRRQQDYRRGIARPY